MKDLLVEIWSSLKRNKLRTCLTGFAVAWGIFMLITLLGAGKGLLNAMQGSQDAMKNSMTVFGGKTTIPYGGYDINRWFGLDTKDLSNLQSEKFSSIVEEVSPNTHSSAAISYKDEYVSSVDVNGVNPIYASVEGIKLVGGRFIDKKDIEDKCKSIVLSDENAKTLLGGRGDGTAMIGEYVKVGNLAYKVVGVFHKDQSMWGSQAYAPYSLIHTLYSNNTDVGELSFSFKGIENLEQSTEFKNEYKRGVLMNHGASPEDLNAIWIRDRFEQSEQMGKGVKIMNTALWILGLLTLISGIVGVSNIMLITVKERTHEFGIRKALGARPGSILKLIITESILITAFFGLIGMFTGIAANHLLDTVFSGKATEIAGETIYIFKDPSVSLGTAIKATLTMITAGALAGLVPARKAAKVMPIEALRAD